MNLKAPFLVFFLNMSMLALGQAATSRIKLVLKRANGPTLALESIRNQIIKHI